MKSNVGSAAIPVSKSHSIHCNALGHAMLPGIFRSNLQGDFARIGRHDPGRREMLGQRHREDAAARADVGDQRRALTPCPSPGEDRWARDCLARSRSVTTINSVSGRGMSTPGPTLKLSE